MLRNLGLLKKYSSKRSDFLRFYLYICHAIEVFACFEMQTKVSENLIWQNSGQYFVAQELKKKVILKCCGI